MGLTPQQIESITRKNPLAFGIFYIDLLEGKKWEIDNRKWANEIYQAVNPWVIEQNPVGNARTAIVQKSTQAGLSTWAMVKMFHFATNWSTRVFYTLPRQQDTLDFASTRVDPMVEVSPFLRSRMKMPNSAHAKRIANSYLFFMELNVEPRMMPADALFVDEVDLSNSENMGTAINRLDASRWKLRYFLSTPTVPGYGINNLYNSSDKRQWFVKCEKCNHEQPIEWENNLRVVGAHNNPKRVYYGCVACDAEITTEHIQTGRWVAEHPYKSEETLGYHVHQMLTTSAWDLYKIFRDPLTTLVEFYRKRLGKPYEQGSGSVSRDDIMVNCFPETYSWESFSDGKSAYFMGVDQGNELQVVVFKKTDSTSQPRIVHIELVPMDKGFARIAQLMQVYRIKRAVVDANPNRHSAIDLVKAFPGRVLVADYVEQKDIFSVKKGLSAMPKIYTNVTINRTAGLDSMVAAIKNSEFALYGGAIEPDKMVELLIDHVTALKRDVETRKLISGSVEVGVWKNSRPDHLAHALLYAKVAAESLLHKKGKVAIGGSVQEVSADIATTEDVITDEDKVKAAVSLLAEVNKELLRELYEKKNYSEYNTLKFPLSHKLKLCLDAGFTQEIIEKAVFSLLTN